MQKAHMLVEKQRDLAKTFEMGDYHTSSARLDLATAEKDIETAISTMKQMLQSVDKVCSYMESDLYEHMEFKELSKEFYGELKKNLLKCFRDEETYGFLKEDERWQELVQFPI